MGIRGIRTYLTAVAAVTAAGPAGHKHMTEQPTLKRLGVAPARRQQQGSNSSKPEHMHSACTFAAFAAAGRDQHKYKRNQLHNRGLSLCLLAYAYVP